ncbi:MAG: helix-turn-helix transcriptional regulator [Omnitrophica WOR_2 bacterium]
MKTTRQRILEFLQVKRSASVSELSRAIHLTRANIRHHLSILADEGVVEVISLRPTGGRGRPVQVYGLTQQALQHNLDGLATALLDEIARRMPTQEYDDFLRQMAARLAAGGQSESRNPSQRLLRAVLQLNQMNYQARWEAHAQAPHVIFAHCPYASILPDHPELCRFDRLLLESLLSMDIDQVARLEVSASGIPQCIFAVVHPS